MRRAIAIRAVVAGAALSIACLPPERIDAVLSAGGDELVVIALGDEQGAIRTAALLPSDQPIRARFDRALYSWKIRRSDLVFGTGAPVGEADLEGLAVVRSEDVAPEDDRCALPATARPQIVTAGDRCPPPPFAVSEVLELGSDGARPAGPERSDALEAARRSLRLAWPGQGCTDRIADGLPMTRCPLLPDRDLEPVRFAAITESGAVALLGRRSARWIPPPGSGAEVARALEMPGETIKAVLVNGESLLVATTEPELPGSPFGLVRVGADLVQRQIGRSPIRVRAFARLGGARPVHLLGSAPRMFGRESPAIASCSDDLTDCREEPIDDRGDRESCLWVSGSPPGEIAGAVEVAGGVAIAIRDAGGWAVRGVDGRWRCGGGPSDMPARDGGLPITNALLHSIAAAGSTAVACGSTTSTAGSTALVLTSSAGGSFSIAARVQYASCGSTSSYSESGERFVRVVLRLPTGRGEGAAAIDVGADGSILRRFDDVGVDPGGLYPSIGFRIGTFSTTSSGWVLARGIDDSIFRRMPGSESFARLFGPSRFHSAPFAAGARSSGGSLVLFSGDEAPVRIAPAASCAELHPKPLEVDGFALPADHLPIAAVRDTGAADSLWLVTEGPRPGRGRLRTWVQRIDLAAGRAGELRELPEGDHDGRPAAAAELSPGKLLVLHDRAILLVTEAEPPLRLDVPIPPPPPESPPSQVAWRLIDQGEPGVVWIASDSMLARITAQGAAAPPRIEAADLRWLDPDRVCTPSPGAPTLCVSALSALCADRVLLALRFVRSPEAQSDAASAPDRRPPIFELGRRPREGARCTGGRLPAPFDDLVACRVDLDAFSVFDVAGFAGAGESFTAVDLAGNAIRSGQPRLATDVSPVLWVGQGMGFTAIGGLFGRVEVLLDGR